MTKLKDMLVGTLGVFGGILFFFISCILYYAPIYVLHLSFWWAVVIIILSYIFSEEYQFFLPAFWIWGLVKAIGGPQDWIAIVFYVLFVLWFILFFIPFVYNLFRAFSKNK